MTTKNTIQMKVSSKSVPSSVAGFIAHRIRENHNVDVQAIGVNAVNQAVKAIAIGVRFLAADGIKLTSTPAFIETEVNGEPLDVMNFLLETL